MNLDGVLDSLRAIRDNSSIKKSLIDDANKHKINSLTRCSDFESGFAAGISLALTKLAEARKQEHG